MFAIVDIKGNQYKISEGMTLRIPKISNTEGESIEFNKLLLLVKDDKEPVIGSPYIEKGSIKAKVLSHGRGEKIRVFKMKPKKRYRKTIGHRQDYTEIEVQKIVA